jgi:hypothetical protein
MCVLFMVIFCFEIQVLVFLHFYKKKNGSSATVSVTQKNKYYTLRILENKGIT